MPMWPRCCETGLLMREPQHICRAVERLARRGDETWQALRDAARRSLVNAIDETSYDGWLTHHGWAVYYKFLKAG